jgi:hypothetical protein
MLKRAVKRLLGERRAKKIAYAAWLASAHGPHPTSLRPIGTTASSRAILFAYQAARGHLMLPRRRLYVPAPRSAKVGAIRWHAAHYGTRFFVETGTYMGETVAAVAALFDRCWTVELSDELHQRARARFTGSNVECMNGDSGIVTRQILQSLPGRALFWLDAHASGGVTADAGYDPLLAELGAIFDRPEAHVVLIDDASNRLDIVRRAAGDRYSCSLRNEIIRAVPRSPAK